MSMRLTRRCLLLIALAVAPVDGKVHKREKGDKGPREVTIKDGDTLDLTNGRFEKGEPKKKEYPIGVQQIFDAVSTNEPDKINKVLDKERVHIDTRGPSGYTPLFESVLKHHVHSVELLIKRGANVGIVNQQGYDALDAAAFGGCAMCAHKLIRAGLDPNTVRGDGFNVLHRALWGETPGHTETVKVLLEAGVSPSKMAKTAKGEVHPLNMLPGNNEATKKVLLDAIDKEAKLEDAADAVKGGTRRDPDDPSAKKDEL